MATVAPLSISVGCPGDLLPTGSFKTALKDMFSQLGGMPGKLYAIGEKEVGDQVTAILDGIEDVLGIFPIGFVGFGSISLPEWEWEGRAEAALNEFKLYVQVRMMELIAKIIPIPLILPILGLNIDVVQLFSSKEYREGLIAQIGAAIPAFLNLIPSTLKNIWNQDLTFHSDEITLSKIWKYIVTELKQLCYKTLWDAFGALIKKFKTIWDALGLPSIPAFLTIDWDSICQSFRAPVEAALKGIQTELTAISKAIGALSPGDIGTTLMEQMSIQYENLYNILKYVQIFGFPLSAILDLDPGKLLKEGVKSANRTLEDWNASIQSFANEWPQYLLELWVVKIKKFLDKIGLGALLDWVTFTICDFLKLIGLPTSISVQVQG